VFDVKDDPLETNNLFEIEEARSNSLLQLAGKMWDEKEALRNSLTDDNRETQSLDEETIEGLKALGYLGN